MGSPIMESIGVMPGDQFMQTTRGQTTPGQASIDGLDLQRNRCRLALFPASFQGRDLRPQARNLPSPILPARHDITPYVHGTF